MPATAVVCAVTPAKEDERHMESKLKLLALVGASTAQSAAKTLPMESEKAQSRTPALRGAVAFRRNTAVTVMPVAPGANDALPVALRSSASDEVAPVNAMEADVGSKAALPFRPGIQLPAMSASTGVCPPFTTATR